MSTHRNDSSTHPSIAVNGNRLTGGSDQPTKKEQTYTVLFYKRKNKVHKAKGASKMDGILTIQPPPKSMAILKADGNSVIFQGPVSSELIRRGAQRESVDETITLGSYQVELLSETTTTFRSTTSALVRASKPRVGCFGEASLRSTIGGSKSSNTLSRGKGLLPVSTNLPRSSVNTVTGIKRSLLDNRKPPLQPSKKIKPLEREDESLTDKSNVAGQSCKTGTLSTTLIDSRPLKPRSFVQEPRISTTSRPTTTRNSSVGRQKRPSPSGVNFSSNVTSAAESLSTTNSPSENFFPGSVGCLVVPHNVKKFLLPHQIEGVTFLWNCLTGNGKAAKVSPHYIPSDSASDGDATSAYKGCILCDEMGLGKTLMTIATICALHRQNRDNRFVVVCPSSLVMNWAAEFDKWIGKASQPKRVIIKGGEEGAKQMKTFSVVKPKYQSEVLIISYDLFRIYIESLRDIRKVGLLVVDEGHRLKNTSGSLTMSALESISCEARLCITATPVQNNLSDLYTIVNFVCPGVLGDLASFRKDYERPIAASSNRNCPPAKKQRGSQAALTLDRIIKSLMLRRLQKDVLSKYLPPRHVFLLFCRPTTEQCKVYNMITGNHKGLSLNCNGPTPEALTALIGLRKVCTHPRLFKQAHDEQSDSNKNCEVSLEMGHSGKLQVLDALLQGIRSQEPTDKVVIVSNFTATLTVVENSVLKPNRLNFTRLDGSIATANRQALVDTFNRTKSDSLFAMTLSSKAGGVGLNLIGANRIVLVDPDWNPSTDIQAMGRIYRQGQKKTCFIYRLFTSGTVEEVICQRQMKKGALVAMTVDSVKDLNGKVSDGLNAEELRDCFTLKACACDTKTKVGNWPEYDGKDSLIAQDCPDQALLKISSKDPVAESSLAFVHMITDNSSGNTESPITEYPSRGDDDNSEFEFKMEEDEAEDEKNTAKEDDSSDFEYCFE